MEDSGNYYERKVFGRIIDFYSEKYVERIFKEQPWRNLEK